LEGQCIILLIALTKPVLTLLHAVHLGKLGTYRFNATCTRYSLNSTVIGPDFGLQLDYDAGIESRVIRWL
jgi:hypothetical protein